MTNLNHTAHRPTNRLPFSRRSSTASTMRSGLPSESGLLLLGNASRINAERGPDDSVPLWAHGLVV